MGNTLSLNSSSRSKLFRAIVRVLQQPDGDVARTIRTWRVWEGKPDDAAAPTVAEMPWCRVTPQPNPPSIEALDLIRTDLLLKIEVMLPGLNGEDILDLWGAIEAALFPGDGSMQQLLQNNGSIGDIVETQSGFGPTDWEGQQVWTGSGVFRIAVTLPRKL